MIAIIGKNSNYDNLNRLIEINSKASLSNAFKDSTSDLYSACNRLLNLGESKFFACNAFELEDYLDIIPQIEKLKIDFIVLIDDEVKKRVKLTNNTSSYFFKVFADRAETDVIISSIHAQHFRSFNKFVSHVNKEMNDYKKLNTINVLYAINHLKESDFAGVDLAFALKKSTIGCYPLSTHGETVFHLEREDFLYKMPYFKNEKMVAPFNLGSGPESNHIVLLMLRKVKSDLDYLLESLKGKTQKKDGVLAYAFQIASDYLKIKTNVYYQEAEIVDLFIKEHELYLEVAILPFVCTDFASIQIRIGGNSWKI